jgi:hypothetical protein
MIKYAPKLRRRLKRGDSIHTTVAWFIRRMADEKLRDADFTPKERKFWRNIVNGHVQFTTRYVLQP